MNGLCLYASILSHLNESLRKRASINSQDFMRFQSIILVFNKQLQIDAFHALLLVIRLFFQR